MSESKGSILAETIIVLTICVMITSLVYSLARFKSQCNDFEYDTYDMTIIWSKLTRCKIYCPKKDPVVDLP